MFKAGDYVKITGYREYQLTFGVLIERDGLFYVNGLYKDVDGEVKMRLYGLALNNKGQNVDDIAYGHVIKKVSKADFTRFKRQLQKGTITFIGG